MPSAVATGRGPRRDAVRRVLWWVLAANVTVILAKLYVGLRSGSIAVLGIAADSGIDALNNVVGLFAVRVAAAPPDEEHPYGHGKFETLGALAVVSFLSVTCFELVRGAAERLAEGAPPPRLDGVVFWVLAATLGVNLAVAGLEASAGRRLGSEILRADARHTLADALVTGAVLGGLGAVSLGWRSGDAWITFLVAVLIAYNGYQILKQTVPVLVDRRALDPERIRGFVREMPGVMGASEIRSRGRPGEAFAELTIHVDPDHDLRRAHGIADRVERELEKAGFAGVVVHVEPEPADRATSGAAEREGPGVPDQEGPGSPDREGPGSPDREGPGSPDREGPR